MTTGVFPFDPRNYDRFEPSFALIFLLSWVFFFFCQRKLLRDGKKSATATKKKAANGCLTTRVRVTSKSENKSPAWRVNGRLGFPRTLTSKASRPHTHKKTQTKSPDQTTF